MASPPSLFLSPPHGGLSNGDGGDAIPTSRKKRAPSNKDAQHPAAQAAIKVTKSPKAIGVCEFAEGMLQLPLYPWQREALEWFDQWPRSRVKGALCTPNGAGKSGRVVASLALWWLAAHPRAKVVI